MKVCLLTSVHDRRDVRIFYKECLSLSRYYEVVLVVGDGLGSEFVKGINVVDVGKSRDSRLLRMIFTTTKIFFESIKQKADIYHFHDPELIPAGLLLKLKGKKVIYDVHEDVSRQILYKAWIPPFLRRIISYIYDKIEKISSTFFNTVITATPFIKERFINYNKNTVDTNNYPIISDINFLQDWSKKKKQICYVGGITRVRGISELLNSLNKVDVELVLAGNISDVDFELSLKKIPSWSKVKYLGYVDRSSINKIIDESIAGIVTLLPKLNYLDSLPVKMFEYMSHGTPVIASDFPLWKQIVEDNNCGICVNPLSPDKIADAINYFLNNREKAKDMGYNGRRVIEKKCNWSIEEKKLLEVYRKLL